MSTFNKLQQIAAEAASYSTAASILAWDQETRMPQEAAAWRAQQLSTLSGKSHEIQTSDEWLEAIEAALESASTPRDLANAGEMKRRHQRASKIPTELVKREAALTSKAKGIWAAAREASDFSRFAPVLEELILLAREKAEHWGYPDEPYDALLETYERGATSASIGKLFGQVRPQLREIATAATARSAEQQPSLPRGPYPVEAQQSFNREVAEALGFRFAAGRIDTSAHPFCTTLGPSDIRLTTRYDESDFTSSLFGVMHEVGHGLYEQGLADADFGTPAGESVSLGIHESQSRLWENHIGRSHAFWENWYPRAQACFAPLASLSLEDFMRHVLRSEFSFIRVEADEATYDLHILLRFDLERQLVNGELKVNEVPGAWGEAFRSMSGESPPDDRRGCLQDIHWSMGGLGYFPTYSLGNLHAAQLFAAATTDAGISGPLERADYAPLLSWLQEKVHSHGATKEPSEIIRLATGKEPSAEAHLRHLRKRYLT